MSWKDLEKRLQSRFGLGDHPLITRRLYRRLQREVDKYGEPVMLIISDVAQASSTATRSQGSWFRAAVVARLHENGFLVSGPERKNVEQTSALTGRLAQGFKSDEETNQRSGDKQGGKYEI